MLTPCPHCDQQVVPDGDGACPLCGGVVLEPGANPEPVQEEPGHVDESLRDSHWRPGETRPQGGVTGDAECGPGEDAAAESCAAERGAGECDDAEQPCPSPAPAAESDDAPVWAQLGDDLVAPQGLLPDDEDEEEDDVVEADAEEPSPPPRQDEARPAAAACVAAADSAAESATAAAVSSPTGPSAMPGMLIPGVLLAAALAVQIAIAIWIKQQEHFSNLAPVFGYAAMLVLGIGALFALGRGATDKVGLRPFTSFQFLMVLFAAVPASVLAAQMGNLISHLCDTQSFPGWLRPPVPGEFPHLALAIASLCIVPALAQELVFRGVIGRSLTAKFGAFIGMLLTCLAFAAAYVFPEWIAKAFVLAIVFQIVFMVTRSLPAAIVTNALCATAAVLAQRYPDALSIPGYTHPQVSPFISAELLLGSGVVLLAILTALYLTRTRFLTAEGASWTPGYYALECPPREAPTRLHSPDAHGGLVVVVVAIFAGFIVLLFWEGQRGVAVVEEYNRSIVPLPSSSPPQMPPGAVDGVPLPGVAGMPGGMGGMPGGMGKGMPGGMGKGLPGGGVKGKPKGGKQFGKGAGQEPLTEGAKSSDRPRRPETGNAGNESVVPKATSEGKIPADEKPPRRPEPAPSPESLEADALPADSLPPARDPAS
jgi:membrane protease YdiL (CAAX protease family)